MEYMYKKPHFFSFSGRATAAEFWSSLFSSCLGNFCCVIAICVLLCLTVPEETEMLVQIMRWVSVVCSLFWGIHIIAMSRRRLRDGGFTAKSYLWLLLPGVGTFIFIFRRLCAYSVE